MSTTTIRRTTTASQFGTWDVSSATMCTNLNDETISTYATPTSDPGTAFINLDQNTYPAGSIIKSVTLKLLASTPGTFDAYFQQPGSVRSQWLGRGSSAAQLTYTWTKTVQGDGRAWNAADVNRLQVHLGARVNTKFYRLEVDVVYNEQPVVSAVTISGTATPTVSWTYTDPDGDQQERYIVRIFPDYVAAASGFNPDTSTRAIYDSGVVMSKSYQHVVTKPLAPGGYAVYVKAADSGSGGRYSLWVSVSYAVAGTPPATPALISAATDAVNGRNIIVAGQNDNLLSYNQSASELADGTGWYIDSNVTSLGTGTTTATNVEGSKVLAMTCSGTGTAKIRSGGTWATAGLGASQNLQLRTWQFNARAYGNSDASVTIAAASGSTLFAFTTDDVDGEGAVTVSSTPSLTWTLVKRQGKTDSGRRDAVTIYRSSSTSATTYTIHTNSSASTPSIGVAEITGAAASPVGASGGGGTVGVVNASYTSTAAGSWGWLVYADWSGSPIPSPDASSVRQAGYISGGPNTSMVLRRTSPTSLSGQTVNLTTTSPTSNVEANYAYVEILPAASPPGVPATSLAGVPVTAGDSYTKFMACWISSPANTVRNVRMDVEWYDITGTLLSTTTGSNLSTVAGNLLADQSETVTAPTNAICAALIPQTVTAPAGTNVYHFDRMGLTHGANARWFRGGMQVRNLLTCDQGSLQGSLGGWTVPAWGAAWITIDRFAYANVKSGQVLRTYVTAAPHTCSAFTGQILAAEVGVTYTGYALALTAAGTPDGCLLLQFEDAAGQVKGTVTGPRVTLGTAAWQQLSVTGTMPADATAVRLGVSSVLASTGTGNAVYWTWMGISAGTTVPTSWQPGPTPNTFPLVEFSDDSGDNWTAVRNCNSVNFDPASAWQATVYDYEAPSNVARLYRVSTAGIDYGIDPLGFYTVSVPTESTSLTLPVSDWYLVDPYVPSRMFLEQEGEIDVATPEPQSIFAPLGRSTEIVTYDRPKGRHLTLNIGMASGAELDAFEALRNSGHILFLQTPYARSWYVKIGPSQATKWLLSPAATGRFNITVELIEVARPV